MATIGNQPSYGVYGRTRTQAESFNGDGSTTSFTLGHYVKNAADIEVLVDNVQQSPFDGSYSVNGTTLTFSGSPSSGTNNIYVIYRQVGTATTQSVIPDDSSVTYAKIATDIPLGNRNLLINASFEVNQRSITSTTSTNGADTFTADRWLSYANGSDATIAISEVVLPNGVYTRSHKTTITSATTSLFIHPYQKVEINRSMNGRVVTCSAWVRTNAPKHYFRLCDGITCWTFGNEIPSDGEWHYVTATTTLNTSLPENYFMQFHPALSDMSVTYTTGHYVEFAQPQMEFGNKATPFEYKPYHDELVRCQRYYWQLGGTSGVGKAWQMFGQGRGANGHAFCIINHPVQMRANPTVSISAQSDGFWISDSVNGATGGTISVDQASPLNTSMSFVRASGTGMTTGYACNAYRNSSANCVLSFDAEL